MKRVLVLFVASLVAAAAAFAGTVVVSGDSNLGNGINGSEGAPIEDNGLFFSNLLGGGTSVALRTTTNGDGSEITSQNAILNYYGGLSGVTVNSFGAPVSPALLSGVNLFIAFLPDVDFTAGETSAIAAFLNGGGTVLLTGEWRSFDAAADAHVNSLLSALGSPLAIVPADLDLGFRVASGSQIAADPLTAGVSGFTYAATSGVTGGTPLFFTTGGTPFMEYASTSNTSTPEPSTLLLVVGAGLGLSLFRRCRA